MTRARCGAPARFVRPYAVSQSRRPRTRTVLTDVVADYSPMEPAPVALHRPEGAKTGRNTSDQLVPTRETETQPQASNRRGHRTRTNRGDSRSQIFNDDES